MNVWLKSILALSASAALTPAVMAKDLDTVVSFSVMADIVKQVGGEHVHVTTLVGPDGDPHTFEPAAKDSVTLKQADVVFINGLGLEGWMDRLVTASGYQCDVVTMSNGVTTLTMEEDGEHFTDPHAWNSAKNGAIYARNVMNALIKADPEDADYYKAKGQAYIEQLEKLDQWAKSEFADVPVEKRKVLTSHDAFGYFGEAYGVSFLSPVGVSTEAQASAKDVAELINQLKSENISAYFIENQTDPRLVEQIAKASGAKHGGELFPEALSQSGEEADTYADAFKHNVAVMVTSMKK